MHLVQKNKENIKIEIPGSKFYFEPPKIPMVVPNDRELDYIKLRLNEECRTPLAVRVRKFSRNEIKNISEETLHTEKKRFENVCRSYPGYEFIFYFQFAQGYELTDEQVKILEEIQRIDGSHFITFYENKTSEHVDDFKQKLKDFKETNKNKIIIPLLDPGVKDLTNLVAKASFVVEQGFKICGVMNRHHEAMGWNEIMPFLTVAGIYVMVFGVFPRGTKKDEDSKYSNLAPPLMRGAKVVSHGMAWRPGPTKLTFLEDDWLYHRKDLPGNQKQNYELSRAKAIIKANQLCESDIVRKELSEIIQSKEVFGYFAKRMGISQER